MINIKIVDHKIKEEIVLFKSYVNGWKENFLLQDPDDAWSKKLDNTIKMIGALDESGPMIVARYKNIPVGLMQLVMLSKSLWIDIIVTHPGTSGVGGSLIEKAVNLSYEHGFEGKLFLCSAYAQAKYAYCALGFKQVSTDQDCFEDEDEDDYDEEDCEDDDEEALTSIASLFESKIIEPEIVDSHLECTDHVLEEFYLSPQESSRWTLGEDGKWKLLCSYM